MKKARRISLAVLAAAICSSLMAGSAFAAPLHPVQHVDWMVKKSILSPGQNGDLALNRSVTLAEAAVVFAKLKGANTAAPTGKGTH
ncbi:bifunctional metallophosphatase/5'-nucleotidase, partial [Anoxybacillus sp. LAT_38]|nr:bifunctional metallophosphatase/5'-nucleotidase [Anoxybacillus sp. LAT_38]